MKTSTFAMAALGRALAVVDLPPRAMLDGGPLFKEVHAVIGRPLTPVSAACVARRKTRRMVVATSVYVPALPPSCTVVIIEGTNLDQCGTTYYQASGSQQVVVNVQ